MGTPTWTSGNTLVYALAGYPEGEPSTLWEAEVDAVEAKQLTDGSEGWDTHPDWSEEAGLLLFSRHQDEKVFGDLLTGDAEAQPGPATSGELWGHPAWSPDGTRVVFTERDSDGTERLAVASLEEDGFSAPQYLSDLPGDPGVPAWGTR
jgi:Tol biopolymer transport system component